MRRENRSGILAILVVLAVAFIGLHLLSTGALAGNNPNAKVAVHVRPHNAKAACNVGTINDCSDINTTEASFSVDAFPIFYDLVEYKGVEFGMTWPDWAYGASFTSCSDLVIGAINNPGEGSSHTWFSCQYGAAVPCFLWLYAYSPGQISVIPHPASGAVNVLDCSEGLDTPCGIFAAGVYGATGDDPCTPCGEFVPLTLTKVDDQSACVRIGNPVEYGIECINPNISDVTGVVLVDTLPPEVDFISAVPAPSIVNGNILTWDLGTLGAGISTTVVVDVEVNSMATPGGVIVNLCSVGSDQTGLSGAEELTDICEVSYEPLLITKSDDIDACAGLGEPIVYTITYQNPNDVPVTDVVLVDGLPSSVDFVSASGGGMYEAGNVTWYIGNLAAGQEGAEQVTVVVGNYAAPGIFLHNQCVITAVETGPSTVDLLTNVCACLITGPAEVCPSLGGDAVEYSGLGGMDAYAWTISGNGTIVGPTDGQIVDVVPGSECGVPFVLGLTVNDAGIISDCSYAVDVNDTEPPFFTECPRDTTLECDQVPPQPDIGAYDNCDPDVDVVSYEAIVDTTCPYNYELVRTWTATDDCGNASECVQTITVEDTTEPYWVTACPSDISVECGEVPDPPTMSAEDNCDPNVIVTLAENRIDGPCDYSYQLVRTWTASDACGNQVVCVQTVTVDDTTLPQITCPQDMTFECDEPIELGMATATDNCDPDPVITFVDDVQPGDCDQSYTIVRLWKATDACGNVDSCFQVVHVIDTTPPVIVCPPDVDVECDDLDQIPVATATDNCDPDVDLSYIDNVIEWSCAHDYVLERAWTAVDGCGNIGACAQQIHIRDISPPQIICAPNKTIPCGTPVVFDPPTVSDNCSPDSLIQVLVVNKNILVPQGENLEVHSRCWQAVDECGNASGVCCQTITVEDCPQTPLDLAVEDDVISCVNPGDTFTYTLTLQNPNPVTVTDVMVYDTLSVMVDFVSASVPGMVIDTTRVVVWDLGDLQPAEVRVLELTVQVNNLAQPGDMIVNKATAGAATLEDALAVGTTEACTIQDCIELDIPDTLIVSPGSVFNVPVIIEDVTGWGIVAFDMEICWCDIPAGLLTFMDCAPTPMTGTWMLTCNECSPNCVRIAGASGMPLVGGGELFNLSFYVSANAKPCMCCSLEVNDVNIYDPERELIVCPEGGKVCVDWCDVEGYVRHWKCCDDGCGGWDHPFGLGGVRVHLFDCNTSLAPVETKFTDSDGHYLFDCLNPLSAGCYYCVELSCPAVTRSHVNAFDATLVLQYLVCLDPLEDCPFMNCGEVVYPQRVAADASCNGMITSYDASLILRYAVGDLLAFPCADPWSWFSDPCDACVTACPGEINWTGVMKGDVDGGHLICPPPLLTASSDEVFVRLGDPVDYGDRYEIAIAVEGAHDIFSSQFELAYDTSALTVAQVVPWDLSAGSMSAYHCSGGVLSIALAHASSYGGDGEVAMLTLYKNAPDAAVSSLVLTDALFNNGDPPAHVGESAGIEKPEGRDYALGPVVPNPFSGSTSISFSVPRATDVNLSIYSVTGQLIVPLVEGTVEPGDHNVTWSGLDAFGEPVARGVYFCRMETAGYSEFVKVVHMK